MSVFQFRAGCILLNMVEPQSALLLKKQLAGRLQSIYGPNRFLIDHFRCTSSNVCILELKKKPVDGFSAGLVDDENIYNWDILVIGPGDTL